MIQPHLHEDSARQVKQVLWVVFFLNLSVAAAKTFWGYLTGSISMQADGIHSFLDATSNVVALIGIWVAFHPPDDTHPYGHRKFETFASFCISVLLFIACFNIVKNSYFRFKEAGLVEVPIESFIVMIATMAVNIWVTRWEGKRAVSLRSEVLKADSLHTRSDVFSSLSVLASLVAVKAGYPILDPLIALIIAGIVGKTGFQILMESSKVLTDYSRIDAREIRELVERIEGIEECHAVRTRGNTNQVYVDLHIHVAADLHLEKAHRLAHRVEAEIMTKFSDVVEVVVHVEPHIPELEND
ncbi:MAG TPA: cation diffusion facilitator family transporter [Nitrospiria bacterium]|nr:cation diffusion facilitator family transporter [Nitrospiria bacterium]